MEVTSSGGLKVRAHPPRPIGVSGPCLLETNDRTAIMTKKAERSTVVAKRAQTVGRTKESEKQSTELTSSSMLAKEPKQQAGSTSLGAT